MPVLLEQDLGGFIRSFQDDSRRAAARILLKPVDDPQRFGIAELDGSFDRTLRACILAVAVSGAVLGFAALAFGGGRTAVGVLVGAGIATLNLWALAKIASAFLSRRGPAPLWAILAFGKLLILVSGVYMLLKEGLVSGLHLAIGYAAMPIGITAGSLLAKPPGDDAPPPKPARGKAR